MSRSNGYRRDYADANSDRRYHYQSRHRRSGSSSRSRSRSRSGDRHHTKLIIRAPITETLTPSSYQKHYQRHPNQGSARNTSYSNYDSYKHRRSSSPSPSKRDNYQRSQAYQRHPPKSLHQEPSNKYKPNEGNNKNWQRHQLDKHDQVTYQPNSSELSFDKKPIPLTVKESEIKIVESIHVARPIESGPKIRDSNEPPTRKIQTPSIFTPSLPMLKFSEKPHGSELKTVPIPFDSHKESVKVISNSEPGGKKVEPTISTHKSSQLIKPAIKSKPASSTQPKAEVMAPLPRKVGANAFSQKIGLARENAAFKPPLTSFLIQDTVRNMSRLQGETLDPFWIEQLRADSHLTESLRELTFRGLKDSSELDFSTIDSTPRVPQPIFVPSNPLKSDENLRVAQIQLQRQMLFLNELTRKLAI